LLVDKLPVLIAYWTRFTHYNISALAFCTWAKPYERGAITVLALLLAVVPVCTLANMAFSLHILSFVSLSE
jgi:hypothetical protein